MIENAGHNQMKYQLEDGEGEPIDDDLLIGGNSFGSREDALAQEPWASSHAAIPDPVTVEPVEQDDETTEDSENTMTYDFVDNGDSDESDNNSDDDFGSQRWGLGDHSRISSENRTGLLESIEATMSETDAEMDEEIRDVLGDAAELVDSADVSNFECPVEACGLGHSHPDTKHDIRSSGSVGYNVTENFADRMEFCPYCHCGVNELSMLLEFFHYIDTEVFAGRDFSGVRDLDPEVVNVIYNLMTTENMDFTPAVRAASTRYNSPAHVIVPGSVRSELREFIKLRQDIDADASRAPIHSEAREAIQQLRDGLLDVTDSHPEKGI
jgi:hypothetical protein